MNLKDLFLVVLCVFCVAYLGTAYVSWRSAAMEHIEKVEACASDLRKEFDKAGIVVSAREIWDQCEPQPKVSNVFINY